ncbi:MAG: (Fe-S)-binding protein [Candidatus Thiodiazotropha sp. (ex Myrtea spinifera)]|nr:(Fe-S)-binding protein [Candidatus Thiodiazotropha sp. (ex Myrtea spinifera)]MCU7828936.1 (Fe-S)-binding protein [Candidatus Thiodiazotropha sp. (ex Myrtea sp. 'scaly one' KF741663)]
MTPEQLLKEADRCVKCGLCLPHCPTYLVLESEADSPRGRISLIQALASGELPAGKSMETHLARCLSCRACESACPSGVKYGALIDGGRALIADQHRGRPVWRRIFDLLSDRQRLRRWSKFHTLLQRSGLIRIASLFPSIRLSRLISLGQFLPKQVGTLTELHAAKRPTGRLVQLFTGCVGSQTDQQLIEQSLSLLSHLGYAVEIPANQVCCGALHRHNGYPEQADRLCETNRLQTEKSRAECLITLASACHLELNEHLKSDLPITGMTDFLLDLPQDALPNLQPLTKKVAIHTPCTSQNDRSQELLRLIPGLEIEELPENSICCGAAGSYLLTQPELSATLGAQKLGSLKASNAEILITGNTGCALQFRQLIEQSDLNIDVMHPLELFARQMENSTGNA